MSIERLHGEELPAPGAFIPNADYTPLRDQFYALGWSPQFEPGGVRLFRPEDAQATAQVRARYLKDAPPAPDPTPSPAVRQLEAWEKDSMRVTFED